MTEKGKGPAESGTLGGLLYHAYVIEAEAEARYLDLADQMEVHNNLEVAALFRKLAEYEAKHAAHVEALRPAAPRPPLDPWDLSWVGNEAPESIAHSDMDYQMTPRKALELSLRAETAAYEFFKWLSKEAEFDEVREMAETFAEEELEHVALLERELEKHPAEPDPPAEDWDPPVDQG
jgi:rubrerythrin